MAEGITCPRCEGAGRVRARGEGTSGDYGVWELVCPTCGGAGVASLLAPIRGGPAVRQVGGPSGPVSDDTPDAA